MSRKCARWTVAGLLAGVLVAEAGDQVTLRLALRKGEVFKYRMTQKQEQAITPPGLQTMKTSASQIFELTHTVTDVDSAGTATVTIRYDRLKVDMDAGLMRIQYDSAAPGNEESMFSRMYGAMAGKEIQVKLTAKGECIEVSGFAAILEEMFGSGAPELAAVASMVKQSFSDEAMKDMFGTVYPGLPAGPVRPGHTWNTRAELKLPIIGTLVSDLTSEYTGIETVAGRDCAVIKQSGTMDMEGKMDLASVLGPEQAAALAALETNLKMNDGAVSGKLYVDRERGFQVKVENVTDMDMEINISMPASADPTGSGTAPQPRAMTQRMKMKSVTRMELVE